ncbi:MAG: hypothetical protein FD127_286 [Acidimicrobiaceae bacterium]|nr:MAG: hypothetical protein FD127_286 [Acidimicrobiaceae bacterium]
MTAEATPVALEVAEPLVEGEEPVPGPAPEAAAAKLPVVTIETIASIDPLTVAVSKRAWIDTDADAQFDDGEAPVGGLAVTLLDADGEVAVTTTDADGRYRFVDLEPGVYSVEFTAPSELMSARLFVDRGVLVGGRAVSDPVTLDGASDPGWDIPLLATTELADVVWSDGNGDSNRDVGDAGLGDVPVLLTDGGGAALASAVTDASGAYRFERVAPVDRRVRLVVLPPGSATGKGGVFTPSATVSGTVWDDLDGNGGRVATTAATSADGSAASSVSALEGLAAGVIVTLVGADGSLVAMTESDAEGIFRFAGLPPGGYAVYLGTRPAIDALDDQFTLSPEQQVAVDELIVAPDRRTELIPDARPAAIEGANGRPDWLPADAGEVALLGVFAAAALLAGVIVLSPRRRRIVG